MANDLLASYSPEDVNVIIAGGGISHSVTGYVDGTFPHHYTSDRCIPPL